MIRPALLLMRSLPASRLALLLALMLGMAVTEGIGLVVLVPMLALLGGGAESLPAWIAPLVGRVSAPTLLIVFVTLVGGRAVLQYAMSLVQLRLRLEVVDAWRRRVFAALVHARWRTLSRMRQSDNISLLVSNVDRLGHGFGQLSQAVASGVTLAAIWIAAFLLAPELALVAVVGGLIVLVGFSRLQRRAHSLGVTLGDRYRAVQGVLEDSLRAWRLIKSHGRESRAIAEIFDATTDLREAQVDFQRAAGRSRAVLQAGAAILLAILVAFALRIGVAMAVLLPLIALFARSVPLLDGVQRAAQEWAHAAPALTEASELIAEATRDAEPLAADAARRHPADTIALGNASLHHDNRDRPAIDRITLALQANRTTMLTGPSGAGKSTLADLFGGLVAPDSGDLLIDGVALSRSDLIGWRHSVAYVHQDPVLFHASIRDNLLWAEPDADSERMTTSLRDAAADFVFDLPDGIDTIIGDAGHQLSGGERQRIALARALLRDPALLILDEATSALDAENEAAIALALRGMAGLRTILVVAHRGALGDVADTIVTLRDGRIERIDNREKARA